MGFNRRSSARRRDELAEIGVRLRWAGRRPRLWRKRDRSARGRRAVHAQQRPADLQFCVNYGGRAEIVDATRAIAREVAAGRLNPGKIDERTIAANLDEPGLPTSTCSSERRASSAPRTSCCGNRRTPSSSHRYAVARLSTGDTCGRRARLRVSLIADFGGGRPGRRR